MIKVETLGMIEVAKNNPVLKSTAAVANNSFVTVDGVLYLVSNTFTNDDNCREDVVIPAGDYLNGFVVEAWKDKKLVVDAKHITADYASLTADTTLLKANADGKLEVTTSAPDSGVYFKVTDKCRLTENAVKVQVLVA